MRTARLPAFMGGALIAALSSAGPLAADDTEIFFGQAERGDEGSPNVVFILDTSGSMAWGDAGQAGTRMQRLQSALHDILDSSSDVNVGLMGLNGSDGGGSVLYPVTPLEKVVCAGVACQEINVVATISDVEDDTEERRDNGVHQAGGTWLEFGENTSGRRQRVALRFRDLNIPQGATITSATLDLDAALSESGRGTLYMGAEDSDDSAPFDRSRRDVDDRPWTSAYIAVNPEPWVAGNTYRLSNLEAAVQEVVSRNGWCGGNALSLIGTGTANRAAKSLENVLSEPQDDSTDSSSAPTLRVSYKIDRLLPGQGCLTRTATAEVEHGDDDVEQRVSDGRIDRTSTDLGVTFEQDRQEIGIRFASVALPRGADIIDAHIRFEVDEYADGEVRVLIRGENSGNPARYDDDDYELSVRNYTSGVSWRDLPEAAVDSRMSTPDLKAIVGGLVNRLDWQSGNAMAFTLERDGGPARTRRLFESFDGEPINAPKLIVRYRGVVQPSDTAGITVTARERMKGIVDDLYPDHGTPLLSAHYEAAQYLLGRPVDYGRDRGRYDIRWKRISHEGSYTGGKVVTPEGCPPGDPNNENCRRERIESGPEGPAIYRSPLAQACQSNHIVILSDGVATDDDGRGKIRGLIGASSCESDSANEGCGTDLARWLYETDHNQNLARSQNITTHTVAFNLDDPSYMKGLADAGGGGFYSAGSSQQLTTVFEQILGGVEAVNTGFTAPGATVNQFNRLTHRDDVYFALFKPEQKPRWKGNLKRYRVAPANEGDPGSEAEILDANGEPAIDPDTGFFNDDARSFWIEPDGDGGTITAADGKEVGRGGAAARLALRDIPHVGTRRVYTYVGDTASLPSAGIDLTADAQKLHESNAAITDEMLGIVNARDDAGEQAAWRSELLQWVRGVDTEDVDRDGIIDEPRRHMGDPMHSRPVIVNYRDGAGRDQSLVYVTTNEGFLHAFDTANGNERWAFSPKSLMPNHREFHANDPTTPHPYGLDGTLSVWRDDPNENFIVEPDEKVYLFSGMRRGGNRYYAFDITDPISPRLAWVIQGGSGGTPGFEELSQSWSRLTPAKILIDDTVEDVLVFGAGYDVDQDPDKQTLIATQSTDDVGRGLFIVRATTGELLWSATGGDQGASGKSQVFADMDYSMPADIRVVDIDLNGLADQLYAADMGGQVWRFDIETDPEADDLLRGGVVAKLNGTRAQDHRRFYSEPDVALIAKGGERFMAISIGSGWRAHPLNKVVEDRLYVIKSPAVRGSPAGYGKPPGGPFATGWSPITEADLMRVGGAGLLGASESSHGWYLPLEDDGEKILGRSLIFENIVYFSSYVPVDSELVCDPAVGRGYAYALDILDGEAARDLDGDGSIDNDDARKELKHGGIPSEAMILMPQDGSKPILLFGTEKVDSGLENNTTRTYWAETGGEPAAALPVEDD